MNALVTGAAGFLGLYVVEQLAARGDHIRALCRRRCPASTPSTSRPSRPISATRKRSWPPAATSTRYSTSAASRASAAHGRPYYENNVLGTLHVIAGCLAAGVRRLIFTSSPSVVFDGRNQKGIDESAPYPKRWLSHYAHTKAIAEQHVLAINGHGGLRTCSLRPHLIWGPRDRHLIPRIFDDAQRGRLRRIGDGTNRVDIVYVENAAAAHLLAANALAQTPNAKSPPAGRAYFISQGEPVNCWRWINEVLALADLPPVRKSVRRASAGWSAPRTTRFTACCGGVTSRR